MWNSGADVPPSLPSGPQERSRRGCHCWLFRMQSFRTGIPKRRDCESTQNSTANRFSPQRRREHGGFNLLRICFFSPCPLCLRGATRVFFILLPDHKNTFTVSELGNYQLQPNADSWERRPPVGQPFCRLKSVVPGTQPSTQNLHNLSPKSPAAGHLGCTGGRHALGHEKTCTHFRRPYSFPQCRSGGPVRRARALAGAQLAGAEL